VAIQKLSRRRFEALIVDCVDHETASQLLKAARNSPSNKKAVAVAIIDGQSDVRKAFELGAHFVLHKPISAERARGSFRAARALMKCERRRAARIAVEMPVMYRFVKGSKGPLERTVSSDLSEDGIGVRLARRNRERGPLHLQFKLPGANHLVEAEAELAWENPNGQAGIRFIDMPVETRQALKGWLKSRSPELEDDPPARCKLTDLSLGGCYLETPSPFPANARVELSMRIRNLEARATGIVRVMHPDQGMGVVFVQKTDDQRQEVETFIRALMDNSGVAPELLVEPEGLETPAGAAVEGNAVPSDDPLLELFFNRATLSATDFLEELRKQRRSEPVESPDSPQPA
jgi:c-di-GMP-binding flagellar brake protein YcgR